MQCRIFFYVFSVCFIICVSFYFGHNKGCKYKRRMHTTLEIYCNKGRISPLHPSFKRQKDIKKQCMCNASCVCVRVHALTCACRSIFQKCPVTLIVNPVPPLVCKEMNSDPRAPRGRLWLCVHPWNHIQSFPNY